ncbi:MAG: cell division protein FtsQ/DivIB [Coriobacteriia bacterium]
MRKRAARQRLLIVRLGVIGAGVLAAWGVWAGVAGSQLLAIDSVEVTGNDRLSAADVTVLAALPPDATLLRFDASGVEERLMESPWIAGVTLHRRPPSTLRITVTERVPVAVVDTGMSFWFVDGDARVLTESVPATGTVLPVIRDLPDFAAEPGLRSASKALRNALAVLRGLSAELAGTVRVVTAPSVNETALVTTGNVEIMIGEAVRLDEKSLLVADIVEERGEQVVFIDVRSVERPISRGLGQ